MMNQTMPQNMFTNEISPSVISSISNQFHLHLMLPESKFVLFNILGRTELNIFGLKDISKIKTKLKRKF